MAIVEINGNNVEFPDDFNPQQLQAAVSTAAAQMGGASKKKKLPIFEQAQQLMRANEFSPSSMLQRIPDLASQGMHKLGTFGAEQLAQGGMNPYASAAVGTAISMAPDIAMAGINPMAGAPKKIPALALEAERRALGFRIPELKTEFARGQAARAAKVGLEQGITSTTGSPTEMFRKASDLAAKSGQKLGAIRESVGPQPLKPIIQAIDDFKEIRLKGASGGKWDTVIKKVEEAKETIRGLVPKGAEEKISLKRIADAKKEIADSVNWTADNVSQKDAKSLAMAIEKGIGESLEKAGGDTKTYKALKPIYSAAKTMIKGLNREVAAQEGNMAISLPSLAFGAGGGAMKALEIGGFELAKRRGAGIAASEIMSAANAPAKLGIPLVQAVKTLSREKAKEFLKEAKGDKDKARQLAKDAGYTIPKKGK